MRKIPSLVAFLVCASLSAPAAAQPATRTCWCFSWVHGPDHGTDCFNLQRACRQGRRRRGRSGRSRACEREEHAACERVGFHEGRRHNLGPTRPRGARLVGWTRRRIVRELGPPTGTEQGWVRFGPRLAILFEGGRAVRLRAVAPEGSTCRQAAEREGFRDVGAPLRRSYGCEWPGQSLRHRLDPEGRFGGRFERETATFEVWLRDD